MATQILLLMESVTPKMVLATTVQTTRKVPTVNCAKTDILEMPKIRHAKVWNLCVYNYISFVYIFRFFRIYFSVMLCYISHQHLKVILTSFDKLMASKITNAIKMYTKGQPPSIQVLFQFSSLEDKFLWFQSCYKKNSEFPPVNNVACSLKSS